MRGLSSLRKWKCDRGGPKEELQTEGTVSDRARGDSLQRETEDTVSDRQNQRREPAKGRLGDWSPQALHAHVHTGECVSSVWTSTPSVIEFWNERTLKLVGAEQCYPNQPLRQHYLNVVTVLPEIVFTIQGFFEGLLVNFQVWELNYL